MTWVEQSVGHAALSFGARRRDRRRPTTSCSTLPLQPGAERDGRHVADPEEHHRHPHPRSAGRADRRPRRSTATDEGEPPCTTCPTRSSVEADGPLRIVRLNRPDDLNAVNHDLHEGLADLFPQISLDRDARAVVITGNGRAFSAGGDFRYLRRARRRPDAAPRHASTPGKRLVLGMVQCRVPVVAAVNGPAVGLGCSLVAAVRRRVHGPQRPPRRPARGGRSRRRRRWADHVAAAHQPAAGQGVRVHRRPDHGRAGARRSGSSTTCASPTRCSTRRWPAPGGSPSCRSTRSRRRSGS